MTCQRPTSVLVIAIVNMVAGTLALFCGVCGIGSALLGQAMGGAVRPGGAAVNQVNLNAYMNQQIPGYSYIEGGYGLVLLLLGITVILAGVGLLWMHRWARWTCIGYALFTFLLQIAYIVFKIAFVMPVGEQFMRDAAGLQGRGASSYVAGYYTGFFLALFFQVGIFLLHAVVLAIFMLLPTVSAAFASAAIVRSRDGEEEYVEDDEYPAPRRRRYRDEDERD